MQRRTLKESPEFVAIPDHAASECSTDTPLCKLQEDFIAMQKQVAAPGGNSPYSLERHFTLFFFSALLRLSREESSRRAATLLVARLL